MVERVPCEKCGNLVVASSRLCPVCRENPSSFRNAMIGIVAVLGLGAVGIQTVSKKLGFSAPTHAEPTATEGSATEASETPTEQANEPQTQAAITGEEKAAREDRVDDSRVDTAPKEIAPDIDAAAASEAEGKAITAALEEGNNQTWSAGGVAGEIEVKPAIVADKVLCRRYRVERDGKKSAYSTVCRNDSGAWVSS